MSCDFVPDECNARAMQLCLLARESALDKLDLPGLNETFEKVCDLFTNADVSLDAKHECLREALQAAFDAAGCPFPLTDPPRPATPDFSACLAAVQDLQAQAADPLGRVSSVMTITFDASMRPIRIQVP